MLNDVLQVFKKMLITVKGKPTKSRKPQNKTTKVKPYN